MKRAVVALILVAGAAAAALLAGQAHDRDREYRRLILEGDEALARGQVYVAIESYSGAIALKPDSMLAYLKRGEAHERRGATGETLSAALRDLRKAAALDPGSTRTLEELGDVNYEWRRFANAAEAYEAYLKLDDRSALVFYKLALASRADGRLTRAAQAVERAVAIDSAFEEAHYLLGLCLRDRGQLDAARAAFERAVALAPAFIAAREELADLHRLSGRMREEIDQLEALYALDPVRPERLVAVGLAHLRAGRRDLAVTALGRAAERFPDYPGVFVALGRVWVEAAEERRDRTDVRKALEALEAAIAQAAVSSETFGLYGRALLLAGETARAELAFRQAAQRFPTDADALLFYAVASERMGHLREARQALLTHAALVDDYRDAAGRAARIGDLSKRLADQAR